MHEFVRFITPEVFNSGIERRLLVGQVAVGQVCKIRIEDTAKRPTDAALVYVEATISVINKRDAPDGLTYIHYRYEASKDNEVLTDGDSFNRESIAVNASNGVSVRTYLSDDLDPRWDGSLRELIDIESRTVISER